LENKIKIEEKIAELETQKKIIYNNIKTRIGRQKVRGNNESSSEKKNVFNAHGKYVSAKKISKDYKDLKAGSNNKSLITVKNNV
jgi:hypothetical protein